jgi:hypothetical protein
MNVWIADSLRQIFGSIFGGGGNKPDPHGLSFTPKCIHQMQAWQLSEQDVIDVFHHGEAIGENKLVRKYNGYEIGMYYVRDKKTGTYTATFVWKRDRR